jgi:hypothetical protein
MVMTSSLCGGTKIDQFTRAASISHTELSVLAGIGAAHLSDKFIYSFKQNIKYSYFIGLCRYKILNIVILLVYVDTNHATP